MNHGICSNVRNVYATHVYRLEWALGDIYDEYHDEGRRDWMWILKPSVSNKGADSK